MRIVISFMLCCLSSFSISAQNTTAPCTCCAEEYRQFDFWLGEWEVTNNGQAAGTNSITLVEDRCVLKEVWKSATAGYTGTSYNYYDNASKTWNQSWVDNQGGNLLLKGRLIEGSMVLMSEPSVNAQGNFVINKITWTPRDDGSVRQHWESSSDLGKSWNTLFDGIYVKKN